MNTESIKKRVSFINRELKKTGLDCLIITKPANVTYSTGFLGDDSFALIAKGRSFLITDSRYTEQAAKECPVCKIIERQGSMSQAVTNILSKYKSVTKIAIENSTTIAQFKQMKKQIKRPLKTSACLVEDIRSIKDDIEIKAIKRAANIAAKALDNTLAFIKPRMSESELAGILDLEIRKLGSTNSFDTIVAFGPNASRAHHQPGSGKLKKNDTILIDFGAKYNGYCSDITRCFIIGKPNKYYTKVYDAVEKAQAAAIKIIKAGVTLKEVDSAAREVIAQSGLPVYGHGTGHGFGVEIHESPFLSPKAKGLLKAGQVITIEPGVYMPGKLGVRIEDDVLVTKTGCEILTRKCPHLPDRIV